MTPREFVEIELKLVETMFDRQKEIYPMFVIIKDKKRALVPVQITNNVQKEIVAQSIKDLVKRSEPDVVVFIAEAWIAIITGKLDRIPLPHESASRFEVVAVHIEFKTGEKYGCEARITRNPGELPRLGPWDINDAGHSMGRFCDFFPIKGYN